MPRCNNPDFILYYTIHDDGVHVYCRSCEFEKNVGWEAWIPELEEAKREHDERVRN
jgi:hypothetical protein